MNSNRLLILTNTRIPSVDLALKTVHILIQNSNVKDILSINYNLNDLIKAGAKVIDLGGAYAIRGFVDHHYHLHGRALKTVRCDLSGVDSFDTLLEALQSWSLNFRGHFVIAVDWDDRNPHDDNRLTRRILDTIDSSRPILVRHLSCHSGIANTRLLERLQTEHKDSCRNCIDEDTGEIGEPACTIATCMSYPDKDTIASAIPIAVGEAHRLGITAVHDFVQESNFETYANALANLDAPLRINSYVETEAQRFQILRNRILEADLGYLNVVGLKVHIDGVLEDQSAALTEPYEEANHTGILHVNNNTFFDTIKTCLKGDFPCAAHVVGDRALSVALDVLKQFPRGSVNARLEHCTIVPDNVIKDLAEVPALVSIQPNWIHRWGQPGGMVETRLGQARFLNANRIKSLLSSGVPIVLSSDSMPPGPLIGIKAALEHPIVSERLTPSEALSAYTTKATNFITTSQALEKGDYADITVLSGNPLTDEIDTIEVIMTIVDGIVVFSSIQ